MSAFARILDVCDAMVARIDATPGLSRTDGSKVQRSYAPTINTSVDSQATLIQGRQINVIPLKWNEENWIDKETVQHRYSTAILVAERWAQGTGEVPIPWIDARVIFVEAFVDSLKSLVGGDDPQNGFLIGTNTRAFRQPEMTAEVSTVALDEFLRNRSLFWSVCHFDWIENVSLIGGN